MQDLPLKRSSWHCKWPAALKVQCSGYLLALQSSLLQGGLPWVLKVRACCCRVILEPAMEGRLRLDAATWGTMGVGLGYAIAAATARPERLVVAIEGDSAFGFSGMECETISRCVICSHTGYILYFAVPPQSC